MLQSTGQRLFSSHLSTLSSILCFLYDRLTDESKDKKPVKPADGKGAGAGAAGQIDILLWVMCVLCLWNVILSTSCVIVGNRSPAVGTQGEGIVRSVRKVRPFYWFLHL